MKIFTKLLISLVLMTSMLFVSLYVLMQWSFDKGLLDYINQREVQGLNLLSDNLIKVHQKFGSWRPLANNRQWWHEIIIKSEQGIELTSQQLNEITTKKSSARGFRPSPPPHRAKQNNNNRFLHSPTKPLHKKNERQPPLRQHAQRENTTANNNSPFQKERIPSLLTANKQVVFGNFGERFTSKSIVYNDKVVGYLALPPKNKLTRDFDVAFAKSQQKTWTIIFMISFLVTIVVSILLSKYLIKKIATLAKATSQLAKGDFSIKLIPQGHDELAELARHFNHLATALDESDKSRKQWIADTSHELRTPLAIIKGEIEALQDGIRNVTPASLQSLADEIEHLQKLINDLGQLSQMDIGALNYIKIELDINHLLTQNLARHQAFIEKDQLVIVNKLKNETINLWADETRINQLFDNIITNSFKYTYMPGKLVVMLLVENKQIKILFEDSAPGVSDYSLTKLFNHLYREENSRNRTTGGSGLGLTLCKKIVEAHQGEISAYQSPLGGLGIKIVLPIL